MKKFIFTPSLTVTLASLISIGLPSCKTPSDWAQVYKPQWEVKTTMDQKDIPVGVEMTSVDEMPLPKDLDNRGDMVEQLKPLEENSPVATTTPPLTPMPLDSLPGDAAPETARVANNATPVNHGPGVTQGLLPAPTEASASDNLLVADDQPLVVAGNAPEVSLVDPLALHPPLEPLTPRDSGSSIKGQKASRSIDASALGTPKARAGSLRTDTPLEIRPAMRPSQAVSVETSQKADILAMAKQIEAAGLQR
jgi:hypothetical protein